MVVGQWKVTQAVWAKEGRRLQKRNRKEECIFSLEHWMSATFLLLPHMASVRINCFSTWELHVSEWKPRNNWISSSPRLGKDWWTSLCCLDYCQPRCLRNQTRQCYIFLASYTSYVYRGLHVASGMTDTEHLSWIRTSPADQVFDSSFSACAKSCSGCRLQRTYSSQCTL